MTQIIDGKAISAKVRAEVAENAARFEQKYGRKPGLHVILVGDDAASAVYVANKEKAAAASNIVGAVHRLPADVSEAVVLNKIIELNNDDRIDGILVQFPVPSHISQAKILETIAPEKDVDGLHAQSIGRLWSGLPGLVSCTPAGCMRLLEETNLDLAGKHAIVVGRSNLVGKPIAALLLNKNCTVTIAHSRTVDLPARVKEADIVIAAVGRAEMIKGDWIKPGAAVIDVGINRGEDGKLKGDVEFESCKLVAGVITPVPGGVGPMTIAMLLQNTVQAAFARQQ